MSRRNVDREGLADELASLPDLSIVTLRHRWRDCYGSEPPMRLGSDLMVLAIGYRMQEQALGGLKSSTRRALQQAAENIAAGKPIAAATLKAGTRLLRDWHGVTHEVVVLDDGALYAGKRYRSLSEVARTITGAQWSGPRFFGLYSHDR